MLHNLNFDSQGSEKKFSVILVKLTKNTNFRQFYQYFKLMEEFNLNCISDKAIMEIENVQEN